MFEMKAKIHRGPVVPELLKKADMVSNSNGVFFVGENKELIPVEKRNGAFTIPPSVAQLGDYPLTYWEDWPSDLQIIVPSHIREKIGTPTLLFSETESYQTYSVWEIPMGEYLLYFTPTLPVSEDAEDSLKRILKEEELVVALTFPVDIVSENAVMIPKNRR